MFRSIGLILSGNVSGAVLLMVRTLVVSRLITLEDFGIASVFVLAMTLVEMMSAVGFQQQMVQNARGNDPAFQAALQGFSVLRGCCNGVILFLLARPLAQFFDLLDILWAFQLIAVVPMLAGFAHFDVHRLSRQMNYLPSAMMALLPPIGSLLAVYPLYHLYGDYRTLLFAIFVQMALTVLVGHGFAKRRYRIAFDPAVMMESLRFGWPFMVSGALLFIVFNGERAIIGRELGLETLALFSMALSLTLTPTLVIGRSTMSFFLPQLSAVLGQKTYPTLTMVTFQAHILLGCVMVVAVALVGGPFLHAVLGEKYAAAIPLLTWLAVVQAFRVFEGGCAIVALAAAHTKNEMMANIVRTALLPVAWFVVAQGGDVLTVIWIGMAGEAAGFAIGLTLALRMQNLPLRPLLAPLGVGLLLLAMACVHASLQTSWLPDARTSVVLVIALVFLVPTVPALRQYIAARSAAGHHEESG